MGVILTEKYFRMGNTSQDILQSDADFKISKNVHYFM